MPNCPVPPPLDPGSRPVLPLNTSIGEAALYNARLVAYNAAIQAYNDSMKSYARCVQGYIAAGEADIRRIQLAIDHAGDDAPLAAGAPNALSNIGLAEYPAPKCKAPAPIPAEIALVDPANNPTNPRRPNSEMDVFDYNRTVRAYNAAVRAHNAGTRTYAVCIADYVAAAKAEIKRIKSAVDSAVAAVNAPEARQLDAG